ncbi:hypothetical protein BGZ83_010137 [Gryganskiella cystojenkinii]|nr:hypothetical protein BGZ83_010137 [Gryganskiella cystojenkinii]
MAHLLPDGNLFLFANKKAILFSTKTWSVIKNYPELPGPPRNYPLSGGSVLLPLRPENNYEPEVLICGGATDFSSRAKSQDNCGRIKPLAKHADWIMEPMPLGRMMPDLTLLHDGTVLILNGAHRGTAGYGRARDPVLSPVRYQPWDDASSVTRFTVQNPSYIPRLYHSVAMPVLDGRVMVAGSNPNANTAEWGQFSVEYRVEMFTPGYLFTDIPRPLLKVDATLSRSISRPNAALSVPQVQAANQSPERGQGDGSTYENVIMFDNLFEVEVEFYGGAWTESQVITPTSGPSKIQVNLLNGGFVTHSTHMSQRLVGLEIVGYVANRQDSKAFNRLRVKGPRDGALTPPGWYQMSVVENGVPSEGVWVRVAHPQEN